MQQQIGRVLERLHSDKHLRMLSCQSTEICCLTRRCPSLSAACVAAHEPALQLRQAAERATAELVREGGDDHVNLLRKALQRQPVQAPAPVAVVQLCVWVTMSQVVHGMVASFCLGDTESMRVCQNRMG